MNEWMEQTRQVGTGYLANLQEYNYLGRQCQKFIYTYKQMYPSPFESN